MAGTGFGLPKGLLNNSTQIPAQSSPILPVPPPPSFGDIKFQLIGRPPRLLERFSESVVAQESEQNMPTAPGYERHQSLEQNAIPRNRFALSQALAEPDTAFSTSPPIIDNDARQGSNASSRSPLTNSNIAASSMRIQNHPFMSMISSTPEDPPPQATKFLSSSVNSDFTLAKSSSMEGNTGQQTSNGALASMQLSYPSASPGPNAITDHVMEDVQPTRVPDRPPLSPVTRKYEGLRQAQAHLRSSILNASSPNLASVALLTESACQKANALHADARQLCNSSQETLVAAQNSFAAAQALFKVADEVKGLAEGAKAELDRLSSNQQQGMNNEIRELFQTMDNWISNQEADEAALRARRVEQLKLRKQKAELARASAQHTATSPSSASTTSTAAAIQAQAPIPPVRQPLFFSPTPEVDVKVDPQTWTQPPSQTVSVPSLAPATADLARRQEDLRKKLKEKRPSAEAESRPASPSDANRLEQQRLEEEQKREEQRQKAALARQLAERKAHEEEERKAREKAQKEKEEVERKARERAEAERTALESAAAEEARKTAEAQKAREVMEAQRKAREAAETRRKSQEAVEEAKRKAQAEEQEKERRQAEAAAEKQRMAAFLTHQKQERERQAKLAEEAKQRALQEEKEREQRLLEEQTRMKAEREREEKLRREQELRRQQVQVERSKILADRAQQILAQRESRIRPPDATSEMNLDTSPSTSTVVLNPRDPRPRPPARPNPPADAPPSPLETQLPSVPSQTSTSQLFSSEVRGISNTTSAAKVRTSPQTTHSNTQRSPMAPLTPVRNPSLPPVAHFSPVDSPPPLPQPRPPPQPTWSIHRLSGDGGNLPYRENPDLSPQAQTAILRHVANALHLPLSLSQPVKPDQSHTKPEVLHVKTEPVQDDSSFLQVPGQSNINEASPIRAPLSQSQAPLRVESQFTTSQQAFPPGQAGQPLSVRALHGSHTGIVLDRPIPSSSSPVTDVAANVHQQQHQQQRQVFQQHPNQPQPSQPPPNSHPQTRPGDHSGFRGQPSQLVPPPTGQRSRSRSPFRMGPDEYDSQPIVLTPSDTNSVYYERPEPQIPPPLHWDHYSPAPRSPPRNSNNYRPNYANRARSPVAGRKRSRDYSPPPHTPIIRDYREYDDRRPRRYSRSPPPRRSRPLSRSPSPPYAGRPPLASRLTQGAGGGYSYRPPSPREPKSSRPELLDRFTDAQPPPNAPTRPGRGRGRRGRGGPPFPGPTHASLEQRISGATLMNRLEDPDPPRRP